ncbi:MULTISPECIES: TerD family protein [unclassified Streptomyces]|uniref:TerD family protein n=1 Tax=unclassified Streptomyces TaxID=2593676 RepID=UPI00339E3544
MNSVNKGIDKAEITLKWDPSPAGAPDNDLDIIAAVYGADAPYGEPVYLVHFGSRSPDGTITLQRESRNGQGFGADEVMTLELYRLAATYGRVVVGVAIQQGGGRCAFGDVTGTRVAVRQGYRELDSHDFQDVREATAATVAEFVREESGAWEYRRTLRGFDTDPESFTGLMGAQTS